MSTLPNTTATAVQGANHAAIVDAIYATMVATYGLTKVDALACEKANDVKKAVIAEKGKSGSHRETLMIETANAAALGDWHPAMIAEASARMMSTYSATDKTVANIVRQMGKVADPSVRPHLESMFATARAAFGTDDAAKKEAFLKAHGHVFGAVISGYVPLALKGEAFPTSADEAHAFAARKNAAALTPAQCAAKVKKAWELLGEVPMISAELRTAIATLGNIKAASFVAAVASAKKLDEVRSEEKQEQTAEQQKAIAAKLNADATREAEKARATAATLAAAEAQSTAAQASLADSSKLDQMLAALTSLVPAVATLQSDMVALQTKKARAPKA
jgi:hypothetical protein